MYDIGTFFTFFCRDKCLCTGRLLESEGTFWYKIAIITLYTNIKVNSKGMCKSNLYMLLALTKYFLYIQHRKNIGIKRSITAYQSP